MFHAPTAEAKLQKDVRGNQPVPEPVRELSLFVPDMAGPVASGDAAGGGAPRTNNGGIARQLAGLHSMYGNQAILRTLSHAPAVIQPKLAVNTPGDEFEQEADRVADQVMRMITPAPSIQRKCSGCEEEEKVQRKCAECEEDEKKTELQRKESSAGPLFAPPVVHDVLRSPGQPLDPATRAFMEPRFSHDFSAVRVHADSQAAESARAVSASAYTVGEHVVFAPGQYSPASREGRKLLAHELTHVLHQGAGRSAIQRQPMPVDVDATAAEVEHLVSPGNDEEGALNKLKSLDMADLLKVVEKIHDDGPRIEIWTGGMFNMPGAVIDFAFAILNHDLDVSVAGGQPNPIKNLSDLERARLKSAFDAAPTRKLRNPMPGDPGTKPTVSGHRNLSAATRAARPGDWGEDPAGNTWVAHTEGIRTYFASNIPPIQRTSTWLANNPSNFDYKPAWTKRAIGSFQWGIHDFAIYFNEAHASADLREVVRTYQTIGGYIAAVHFSPDPSGYIQNMRQKVAVTGEDPTSVWTNDDQKWDSLIEGFKSAEGWQEGTTVTTANVTSLSSDPKDALVAYYKRLLGSTGP